MRTVLVVSLLALTVLASCGHADACGSHSHDPTCLVCTGAEDPLTPGETLTASNGFTLELVSATPAPFIEGTNDLVVKVRKDGVLVDGVDFTGTQSWYPVGGHGSPLLPTVTTTANPGEYTITPVNFLHAGAWELRFSMTAQGVTSTYNMPLCIEEAPGA